MSSSELCCELDKARMAAARADAQMARTIESTYRALGSLIYIGWITAVAAMICANIWLVHLAFLAFRT